MDCVKRIFELFDGRGDAEYFGEPVSQKEHALQVAHFAAQAGASEPLIVAGLLHDVGHLLAGTEEMAENGIDGHHEAAGGAWLKEHFGPEVTEPVRMHVEAKRYLCYADAGYLHSLSPASVLSLQLQGGPFDPPGAQHFYGQPYAADAVRLRRWDDQGKIPDFEVPGLEHYRAMLVTQASSHRVY
jgi:[1-hydroxy-2-(trimethylamino)ethyl]phosphonate dioxygenase